MQLNLGQFGFYSPEMLLIGGCLLLMMAVLGHEVVEFYASVLLSRVATLRCLLFNLKVVCGWFAFIILLLLHLIISLPDDDDIGSFIWFLSLMIDDLDRRSQNRRHHLLVYIVLSIPVMLGRLVFLW